VSMDLILCRNVTIYFTEEVTRMVIHRLHEALIDGGWLIVGHSEPSLTVYRAFQTHMAANTVLYQKTGRSYDPLHNRLGFRLSRPRITTDTGSLPTPPPEPAIIATTAVRNGKTAPLLDVPPAEPDLYEVARVLVNKGYTQEAIDELHRKLADTSDFAPAHSLLGRAYANLGQWKEARYWCESALKLDSLQAEAYYVLSSISQHEGDLEEAIDMLKKAIYLDREAPLLHFNLALLYKKSGQVQKSRRACQNTIRVLEKWPPASIVPDSGGATAKHLLEAARRIMGELGTG
jgi:chemotaxis protein methyltransferase CheR